MSKEAIKLALQKFAKVKELCDKHGSKINRKHVYGGALVEHFDVVCQALAEQPTPVQQEPVACHCNQGQVCHVCDPITPPAQRTWVGLTDEEISEIAINNPPMVHEFARAIEAKSREKNQ